MATHSSILARESHGQRTCRLQLMWSQMDTTERLSTYMQYLVFIWLVTLQLFSKGIFRSSGNKRVNGVALLLKDLC